MDQNKKISLRQYVRSINPLDIINLQTEQIQLNIFEEQQLAEMKSNSTSLRIRREVVEGYKDLCKKFKVKNHGKLMESVLEEMLVKLQQTITTDTVKSSNS